MNEMSLSMGALQPQSDRLSEVPAGMLPLAIVTTTVDSAPAANALAQAAVQARLAACAQVEAIASHYIWQGQLTEGTEWRIAFKTLPAAQAALQTWLAQEHPYDVPQLLLRGEWANAAYAEWVAQQVSSPVVGGAGMPVPV